MEQQPSFAETPQTNLERTSFQSEKEIILETREKSGGHYLNGGMNITEFVELKDDGSGIFKPITGENEIFHEYIKKGTFHKRERAAYLVDQFLDFDLFRQRSFGT